MPTIPSALSDKNVTSMFTDASQISLLIWAIVAIIVVFSIALVVITKTFVSNSNKTNEGYKELMKQNSDNLSEFRRSVDSIGEVIRNLSERIATEQTLFQSEASKFDFIVKQQETLKREVTNQVNIVTQILREHDANAHGIRSDVQETLKGVILEAKNLKQWCMMTSISDSEDGD